MYILNSKALIEPTQPFSAGSSRILSNLLLVSTIRHLAMLCSNRGKVHDREARAGKSIQVLSVTSWLLCLAKRGTPRRHTMIVTYMCALRKVGCLQSQSSDSRHQVRAKFEGRDERPVISSHAELCVGYGVCVISSSHQDCWWAFQCDEGASHLRKVP
jgi:hypothetical protein